MLWQDGICNVQCARKWVCLCVKIWNILLAEIRQIFVATTYILGELATDY